MNGWRCLDAFAGTGALGFEAASRGAGEVGAARARSAPCSSIPAQHPGKAQGASVVKSRNAPMRWQWMARSAPTRRLGRRVPRPAFRRRRVGRAGLAQGCAHACQRRRRRRSMLEGPRACNPTKPSRPNWASTPYSLRPSRGLVRSTITCWQDAPPPDLAPAPAPTAAAAAPDLRAAAALHSEPAAGSANRVKTERHDLRATRLTAVYPGTFDPMTLGPRRPDATRQQIVRTTDPGGGGGASQAHNVHRSKSGSRLRPGAGKALSERRGYRFSRPASRLRGGPWAARSSCAACGR